MKKKKRAYGTETYRPCLIGEKNDSPHLASVPWYDLGWYYRAISRINGATPARAQPVMKADYMYSSSISNDVRRQQFTRLLELRPQKASVLTHVHGPVPVLYSRVHQRCDGGHPSCRCKVKCGGTERRAKKKRVHFRIRYIWDVLPGTWYILTRRRRLVCRV